MNEFYVVLAAKLQDVHLAVGVGLMLVVLVIVEIITRDLEYLVSTLTEPRPDTARGIQREGRRREAQARRMGADTRHRIRGLRDL